MVKKITYILSKQDKRRLILIFIGMLISSFFDLVGVSAVLPIVTLLTSNQTDGGIYGLIVSFVDTLFNHPARGTLVIILIVFLSIFYLIKGLYTILLNYVTSKFNMSFNRRVSTKMIKTYLSMPYEYHLQHNSSSLLRSATYDSNLFVGAMNAVMIIVLKGLTALLLFGYLIYNDIETGQFTTLIVGGTIGTCCFFIVFVLKKHIKGLSIVIQRLSGENYRLINQAFEGIKESKISNREFYFANEYEKNVININHYQIRRGMYGSVPTVMLETFGLIALLGALVVSIFVKDESEYPLIVASFSVLALSTIKLLPAAISLIEQINGLAYSKVSVDLLYNDIKHAEQNEEYLSLGRNDKYKKLCFNNTIAFNNVSFVYNGTDKVVLDNISFSFKKGESIAISGDSGAGKTTTVDLLLGLLKPTNGKILCDRVDIETNIRGWHDNLSYIPQNIYLMDDTIRRNVAFGYLDREIDDRKVWEALEKAQLLEFVNSLPNGLDTIIGERGIRMSGGQRQRIGIARAFYRNTQIIVFDEATSALDYETERKVLEHINKYKGNHTLVIITHRLNTIETCDHIFRIEKGFLKQIK